MWIVSPSILSAYAQASECSIAELLPDLSSWASEAERSSTLNGKLTLSASWLRAWKREAWMRRLSGSAILENCQPSNFAEWWIASLPEHHVRTYLLPVAEKDLTASEADSFSTPFKSQPIAVRDSSFWRTSLASLLPPPPLWAKPKANLTSARPPESWENWPTSGGIRNGSLFLRPTWVPRMVAQDGFVSHGKWDTPDSMPEAPNTGSNRKSQVAGLGNQAKAMLWQTPKDEEASGSGRNSRGEPKLKAQANTWLTPHGMSGMEAETGKAGAGGEFAKQVTHWIMPTALERSGQGERNRALILDVENWPTPKASEMNRGVCASEMNRNTPSLRQTVYQWSTPAARDYRSEVGGGKNDGAFQSTVGAELTGIHPLFAPGPADTRWFGIIDRFPWLAPAISDETQSILCAESHGLADTLDFDNRSAQLRALGNGCVPLQAATALVLLARRAGIFE